MPHRSSPLAPPAAVPRRSSDGTVALCVQSDYGASWELRAAPDVSVASVLQMIGPDALRQGVLVHGSDQLGHDTTLQEIGARPGERVMLRLSRVPPGAAEQQYACGGYASPAGGRLSRFMHDRPFRRAPLRPAAHPADDWAAESAVPVRRDRSVSPPPAEDRAATQTPLPPPAAPCGADSALSAALSPRTLRTLPAGPLPTRSAAANAALAAAAAAPQTHPVGPGGQVRRRSAAGASRRRGSLTAAPLGEQQSPAPAPLAERRGSAPSSVISAPAAAPSAAAQRQAARDRERQRDEAGRNSPLPTRSPSCNARLSAAHAGAAPAGIAAVVLPPWPLVPRSATPALSYPPYPQGHTGSAWESRGGSPAPCAGFDEASLRSSPVFAPSDVRCWRQMQAPTPTCISWERPSLASPGPPDSATWTVYQH
eukprot:TRINITY_DN14555_c0_g1_i1.p1 TRINITY_DN14555_c0_g1~~TRINITY_DN14555_c0_g1_i1.p1  ORF type:complete len:425 (+),score=66.42 TRINITY_DN14555_c0_g1_i1:185-1459(+)